MELAGAGHSRLLNALSASGVPALGSRHPGRSGLLCSNLTARPVSREPTMAIVEAEYSSATADAATESADGNGWTWDISPAFVSEVTNKNVAGGYIETRYASRAISYDLTTPRTVTSRVTTRHRVEVERPAFTLRFTKEVTWPLSDVIYYNGAVNAAAWQGQPRDAFRCQVSSGRGRNGDRTTTLEFQYNPVGWQPVFYYFDPTTGRIPQDVTDDNGIDTAQVYERRDFNRLGLPRV
jgi:hypothetical protein